MVVCMYVVFLLKGDFGEKKMYVDAIARGCYAGMLLPLDN